MADPAAVGKQVNINNVAFTIAGVTPPGFAGTSQVGSSQDVSLPLAWEPQINGENSNLEGAGIWWLRLMGRLKPGATMAQAEASLVGPFQQSVLEHRALRKSDSGTALRTLDPKRSTEARCRVRESGRDEFASLARVAAAIVSRSGWRRAADRVCKRRELVAGARVVTKEGDRSATCCGRESLAIGQTVVDGKRFTRCGGWSSSECSLRSGSKTASCS